MREGEERTAGAEGPQARRRAVLGLGGLGLCVAFLVHLRAWSFLCDDAFISFRYARNLGRHGQLVYNLAPFERVEGYTNLLWVLVLAVGEAVGLDAPRVAPILTAGSALVALVLVAGISARLRRRFGPAGVRGPAPGLGSVELGDLLAPALLITVPEFVVWGSSGLEGSFALALGLLAAWLWLGGKIEGAAVAAAAAGLARPDELVWIACFGLGWLAAVGLDGRGAETRAWQIPWRRVALAAALFVIPLGAALLFRRAYYGEWLPNTWAVKQHGAALRGVYGVGYLEFWARSLGLVWLAPLVVLLRPRHLVWALPVLAQLAWAWSVGGDFMAYGRFLLPATTLGALGLGLALTEVPGQTTRSAWIPVAALGLALLGASATRIPDRVALDRSRAHLHVERAEGDDRPAPGFEGVDGMHRFAALRYAAGLEFARRVPADTRVTVGAAGAMPYASMLPTFDAYGLVDPGVLAVATPRIEGGRPGHQLHAPLRYMKSHEPDLMCHVGYAGEQLPPRGLDRRMRAGRGWTGWACVETGPIPDPRAEAGVLPSQVYCCLRRSGRFEELDETQVRRSP